MQPLPPEALPAVPHISFWILDLAVPNLIVVAILTVAFGLSAWARLPLAIEGES